MSYETLYHYDHVEARQHVEVPAFIEQDITCSQIAAIIHGGCESGAYMPAATYGQALETMQEHHHAVWDLLENYDALQAPESDSRAMMGWANLAVYFLSMAVDLWALSVEEQLTDAVLENEEEGER